MIQIRAIDHLVLRVIDLPAMIDFYTTVLGCTLERSEEAQGLYQLRAGSSLIDLVPVNSPLGRQGGVAPSMEGGHNLDHFCLRIEPFDETALREHFHNAGIALDAVALRYGAEGRGPSVYIHDPEGNTIELKGPPNAA